ncbi:MAG: alkaline phosphatase [Bacteroidales bacterium]
MNNFYVLNRKKVTALLLFIAVFLSSYAFIDENKKTNKPQEVKNIILLIGDGMGVTQVSGAMTISGDKLNMTNSRHIGLIKTHSFDDYNTDSAAGGTAISSGKKTKNGMIGMSADSNRVKLITEIIRRKKEMSYGVVSTSSVTHATPASFVAHNISRNDYEGIALDFVRNKPDVFIGGGKDNFIKRRDQRDLIRVLENDGYQVVFNMDDLIEADAERVAGLMADGHMPALAENRGDMLSKATGKSIELLNRNRKGFFLMVEGSQIDWGGHANDTQYVLEEMIDFDKAVGVALQFAASDPNTLVLVTSDHETGGMVIQDGELKEKSVSADFGVSGHTGVLVPVFAFGAGADMFTGVYENTGLFDKMIEALKLR